nr:uncharacterized protein LOC115264756 [Aedes albopictus]
MICNAPECRASSTQNVWMCSGTCGQSFHAACIGAKRDWEDNLRNYVLPLCKKCASSFLETVDLKMLSMRQMEHQHKIHTQLEGITIMLDMADAIERRLTVLEQRLCENASHSKNIMDGLSNMAQQPSSTETADQIGEIVRSGNSSFINIIKKHINESVEHIIEKMNSDRHDLLTIASASGDFPSEVIIEIMDEVKTLSTQFSKFNDANSKETLNSSLNQSTSLQSELNAGSTTHDKSGYASNTVTEDKSGWRLLGSRNIWKADWTDYDKRQSNRLNQQKQADKARKRKKRTSHNNIRNAQNKKKSLRTCQPKQRHTSEREFAAT